MSKVNTATSEQSMEDILASIRKIIAEDAPTSAAVPTLPPPESAAAPPQRVPMPAMTPGRQASLDDVLGLADDNIPTHRAPAAPAQQAKAVQNQLPTSAESGVPSWLFPKAPPVSSAAPVASAEVRSQPKPFFPPQSREVGPLPAKGNSDLGSFVPGRVEPSAAGLSTPPQVSLDSAKAAIPVQRPVASAPEPKLESPAATQHSEKPTPSLTERMNGLASASTRVPLPQPMPHELSRGEQSFSAPAVEPQVAAPATATPPDQKAAFLSSGAAKPIVAQVVAALPPATTALAEPAVPKAPVVASAPPPAPTTTASAPLVTTVSAAPTVAPPTVTTSAPAPTMEDTVSELLRPMLRQWLDQNMPRVIEKALRSELAAGSNSKPNESKH